MSALLLALCLGACGFDTSATGIAVDDPPPQPGPVGLPDPGFEDSCSDCHGDENSPAPPRNLAGNSELEAAGVGAHRQHLDLSSTWHSRIECADCHRVPKQLDAEGHIDGDNVAELTFSARAGADGAAPEFDDQRCTNVYCHGATLDGGSNAEPTWLLVDGSQSVCGSCHGAPPPPPHPEGDDCGTCHPTVEPGSRNFLDPDSHINGTVEVAVVGDLACDACHGSEGISAPPVDLAGNVERSSPGVGAHRQHLGRSDWRREITCSNCHVVPSAVGAATHIDGDGVAEVRFDLFNPQGTYSVDDATCANLYCHGNGQANNGSMLWVGEPQLLDCGACHGDGREKGLGGEHDTHLEEEIDCVACHQTVVAAGRTILAPTLHIDGVRQVSIASGGTYKRQNGRCVNLACHKSEAW